MKQLLLVVLASITMACVSTNATLLNPTPSGRAPIAENQVRIFRTAAQVMGKYEEVALLNSTGESNWTNEQKMMESMRKKAASLGANGVILDDIKEAGAGAKVAAAVLGTGTQRKGRAIAIFVFPDSAAKAP
ncbi:hypothetical protein [Gemmatimonas sp.]|uniref:hypothetical protein n=1 Tax=Gemmatimonas sp. TaxID=1962908 RepID=UPI00286E4F12|nr:hypothetical protein [Gemmatimonas sp.]